MNWKIKRDPYYSELFEKFGEAYINEAGFMYDASETDVDISKTLDIMCTPLNFLNTTPSVRECVLLTTGSFSPIHSGHVEMLTKSREHLESLGWNVMGGYFAPDHDEYITWKLKEEAIPIHYRMKYISDAIRDYDWLAVDPWAGIFQKVAVNFTDIIQRLEMYLHKHLGRRVTVFYVFGGDNAKFIKTFKFRGHAIITTRPGYEDRVNQFSNYIDNDRTHIVSKSDGTSSTDIRKMVKWKSQKKDLILRLSERNPRGLEKDLLELFPSRFENITYNNVDQQRLDFNEVYGRMDFISLDPMIKPMYQLQLSREYDYFGLKFLGYTNRPGTRSLQQQVLYITRNQRFFLFDDDIHSGGTIKFATKLLEERGVSIAGVAAFTHSSENEEIADMRDFMFGEEDGGLVVRMNDELRRVPYVYPFVCPFARASVNDPLQFSIDVWRINMEHYSRGFNKEFYEECKYYYEMLLDLQNGK
jgi:nicotinic acid mononucleotide adenylyltransferase